MTVGLAGRAAALWSRQSRSLRQFDVSLRTFVGAGSGAAELEAAVDFLASSIGARWIQNERLLALPRICSFDPAFDIIASVYRPRCAS